VDVVVRLRLPARRLPAVDAAAMRPLRRMPLRLAADAVEMQAEGAAAMAPAADGAPATAAPYRKM
jgi:hypothetical protein